MIFNVGLISASLLLGITALGSGIGINICGQAAIGAWKKCFLSNKPAPMMLVAFAANPVTQVFYAYIVMSRLMEAGEADPSRALVFLGYCLAAGISLFVTAIIQGKIGACAVEALVETRKGFAHFYAVMGAAETVALFTMVFTVASV
jgi:V/A-type H+-transporting ATPase subunit K